MIKPCLPDCSGDCFVCHPSSVLMIAEIEALNYQLRKVQEDSIKYRNTITGVIDAIKCWKVPLLDPDGNDSSEAVMRLIAQDLQEILDD